MFEDVWDKVKMERESEPAFQEALDSDRLTYDPSSYLWVYNFMYMGTYGGGPQFKHKYDRQYLPLDNYKRNK